MCAGVQPFKGMFYTVDDQRAEFLAGVSPDLSDVALGLFKSPIQRCLNAQYKDMEGLSLGLSACT